MLAQGLLQRGHVIVNHYCAVKVNHRGDQLPAAPLPDLVARIHLIIDIHFDKRQAALFQPVPDLCTIPAPSSTIKDNFTRRYLFFRHDRGGIARGSRRNYRCFFSFDLAQHLARFFIIGLVINIMDIDIADDPLPVDDKNSPLGFAIFVPHYPIPFCHLAVRPKVTQQRVSDTPQAFGPGTQTVNMVDADAQNLGI